MCYAALVLLENAINSSRKIRIFLNSVSSQRDRRSSSRFYEADFLAGRCIAKFSCGERSWRRTWPSGAT